MALNFFKNIEAPAENKEDNNSEADMNRRQALKKMLKIGAGTAAVMIGAKKISELLPEEKEEADDNQAGKKSEAVQQEQPRQDLNQAEPDSARTDQGKENKKRTAEVNEKMNPEEIAEEILRAFYNNEVVSKMPPEVFTPDFFIAQQFQESRYDKTRVSRDGASGVYQNLPVSIMEVVEYLNALRKKENVDYQGPSKIDNKKAEEIKKILSKKEDWGRAIGKLYLLSIYDPDYKYNQYPNKNVFADKSPQEIQKLLLISYHDGPGKRYNPEKCSRNARNYYRSVFNFKEEIKQIRKKLATFNFSGEEDYAVVLILRELDNYRDKEKRSRMLKKFVQRIEKKQEENREFSHADLKEIFS